MVSHVKQNVILCGLGSGALALTAMAAPAFAEESAPVRQEAVQVGEVLVTAQRRTERVIDIPVSVSALAGATLKTLGVTQPTQLANVAPGVQFQNTGPTSVFNIRGITLNDYGDANEAPVAFYRDDVYIAALGGTQSQLFDINRVEIIRGPQGTLFGRNATGGLIAVFSNTPSKEFEADASLQYGSYNQVIAEGAVSGPITDRLRVRLAGQFNRDDGWQKNLFTGTRFAKTNTWAARGIADFDITSKLLATLNVHGGRVDNISPGYGLRGRLDPVTFDPCSDAAIVANQCVNYDGFRDPHPDPTHIYSEQRGPKTKIDTYGLDGQLKYTGDGFDIVSITGYETTNKYYEEDGDGSPTALGLAQYRADRRQISEEVRASGEWQRLKWVVGAYYFDEELTHGLFSLPQYIPLYGTYGLQNEFNQKTQTGAVFGQVDYRVTDAITLTGGARYSSEKKSLVISDDFAAPTYIDHESVSVDKVTWKVGASWKFAPEWLTYANVSTGFKSPAFNTTGTIQGGSKASNPESNTNYEAGLKGQMMDRRVQISAAAFYTDYKDFQLIDIPVSSTLPISQLINAKGARIYGFELEVNSHPVQPVTLNFSVSNLHTQIRSPGLVLGSLLLDGKQLTSAPEWSLKAFASYGFDAGSLGVFTPRINATYFTAAQHSLTNVITSQSPAYPLVDAGLAWSPERSAYQIEVFVDNLSDQRYLTYAYDLSDTNALQWGKPRTWGVRVSTHW
jgi:iron complex outermembrane receptor protein